VVRDLTPALVAQVCEKLRARPNGDRLVAVIEGGKARTSARWKKSSAKNYRPGWCWRKKPPRWNG
jgi:hypothetical protein